MKCLYPETNQMSVFGTGTVLAVEIPAGYRYEWRETWEGILTVSTGEYKSSAGAPNVGLGIRVPLSEGFSVQADVTAMFPNTTGSGKPRSDRVTSLNLGLVLH